MRNFDYNLNNLDIDIGGISFSAGESENDDAFAEGLRTDAPVRGFHEGIDIHEDEAPDPATLVGSEGYDIPWGSNEMSNLTFTLNDTGGVGPGSQAEAGFLAAVALWQSFLADDVNVRLDVGFAPLSPGVLGQAGSNTAVVSYAAYRDALIADGTSADDATAIANLEMGNSLDFATQDQNGNYILDDNDSNNNMFLSVQTSVLRALGITTDANGNPIDDGTSPDASITFNSNFTFDFDPTDGIDPGAIDFVGVAFHEIGHALGFTSGVDIVDGNSTIDLNPFAIHSALDVFRYSDLSQTSFGAGTRDLGYGGDTYFSIDGGVTNLGRFSTGVQNGDGRQASHWKDGLGLGIMDPTSAPAGQANVITMLDIMAFDIIGWDLVSAQGANSVSLFDGADNLVDTFASVGDALAMASNGFRIEVDGSTYAAGTEMVSTGFNNMTFDLPAGVDTEITLTGTAIRATLTGDGSGDLIGNASNNNLAGNAGDNSLSGNEGNDLLFGNDGNDILDGGSGDDVLSGGAGNDRFIGGAGADTHLGSAGSDIITYSTSSSRVVLNLVTGGTVGDAAGDSYSGIEIVVGSAFNDNITGGSGSDSLFGGNGNDSLFGSGGFDVLNGGAGDDTLSGGDDRDTFIGGAGADTHLGGGGLDVVDYSGSGSAVELSLSAGGTVGDAAGDTYFGVESVIGTDFDDTITGGSASESLFGGDGNDTIDGAGGNNTLDGGNGDDTLTGGVGRDTFIGGEGADDHFGGTNIDTVDYSGSSAGVALDMGLGGTAGDAAGDTYDGIERIFGSEFDDLITGDNSNNQLRGNGGDDVIEGGAGNDVQFGGLGNDTFVYDTAGDGFDTIVDFETGMGSDDVINIVGGDPNFDSFAEIMAAAFQSGTTTVFDFGGINRIRVLNTQIADFDEDDFIFGTPPPGNESASETETMPAEISTISIVNDISAEDDFMLMDIDGYAFM